MDEQHSHTLVCVCPDVAERNAAWHGFFDAEFSDGEPHGFAAATLAFMAGWDAAIAHAATVNLDRGELARYRAALEYAEACEAFSAVNGQEGRGEEAREAFDRMARAMIAYRVLGDQARGGADGD